jgi:hypothetical protein
VNIGKLWEIPLQAAALTNASDELVPLNLETQRAALA